MGEATIKPEIQRLAAYAIVVDNSRLLLCRLTNLTGSEGMWTLPGGKVEFGEHPDLTVAREVKEETGLKITPQRVLSVNSELFHFNDSRMHAIRLIYEVKLESGSLAYEKGGTTDICEYFTLEQAKKLPLVSLAKYGVKLAKDRGLL